MNVAALYQSTVLPPSGRRTVSSTSARCPSRSTVAMKSCARWPSVKQVSTGLPIRSPRARPVSSSMVWFTSVITPVTSVITSASVVAPYRDCAYMWSASCVAFSAVMSRTATIRAVCPVRGSRNIPA